MVATEHLQELGEVCGEVRELTEGGKIFIYIARLRLPAGCVPSEVEGLLCIQEHSGYATRLFLSHPIPGRGANWSVHHIVGRAWHSWSWNNVSAQLRPAQMLAEHLRALR
jgi:hypothetical protein